jgi:hypothetical protein
MSIIPNISNIPNISDITKPDICLCIHIGNIYLAHDIFKYIENLDTNFDVYITINYENKKSILFTNFLINIGLIANNVTILYIENYGADIYPFIYKLKYFADKKITYKYLLKLHTKTENVWRHNMINFSVNQPIEKIKEEIEKEGIYGFANYQYDTLNHHFLIRLLNSLGIKFFDEQTINRSTDFLEDNTVKQNDIKLEDTFTFVPGTIFWAKFDIFMQEFNSFDKKIIHLYDLVNNFKIKFKKDSFFQRILHSVERLFGVLKFKYKQNSIK